MTARAPIPPTPAPPIQEFSHIPGIPPPVSIGLKVCPPTECPYLPDRAARLRLAETDRIEPALYHEFMDAGFRRSGRILYQPVCRGCRECIELRVPVQRFVMSKSQRRCWRKNRDVVVTFGRPVPTVEKYALYRRYLTGRHGQEDSASGFKLSLYDSPTDTIEFEYRLPTGKLIAVGICDLTPRSLSSVYFYFDPEQSRRSPGTFGVLQEIDFARRRGIPYLYLGYWVPDSTTMVYKADFRPHELLCGDGVWREG